MALKKLIICCILFVSLSGIAAIFWYQETMYLLPTPVPENYQPIAAGSQIDLTAITGIKNQKPVMLHFFNPDCPCSRFNIDHFRRLVQTYGQQISFYAVLQVEEATGAAEKFQAKYDLSIPVIIDTDKKLAEACGVYSTPQAAIITQNGVLYYRGNYNKTKYCTNPNSNFAQMALDSLLAGKQTPEFIETATRSYGCELPESVLEASVTNLTH